MEQSALERIEISFGGIDVELGQRVTLRSYLANRLMAADPLNGSLGQGQLDSAMSIAQQWTQGEIQRQKIEQPYPPTDWLTRQTTLPAAEKSWSKLGLVLNDGRVAPVHASNPTSRDWERIKRLMVPGDELWTFRSPPESWQALAGQMGIALVRMGRPIASATLVWN